MDQIYASRFPGYYICIDEQAFYGSETDFLNIGFPIKIMYPDYIRLRERNGKQRGFLLKAGTECYPREDSTESGLRDQRQKLSPVEGFQDTVLLMYKYNANQTIWEQIILKGLQAGKISIDDNQLNRICTPDLNASNSSLLHKWARCSATRLQEVFSKTSISTRPTHKVYPFFLNFAGKSPLDIALENFDLETFQFLLCQLIEV